MRIAAVAAAALALLAAAPVVAEDKAPCGKGLICASDPPSVAAGMMKAGYQALIGKDQTGDPMIESAASGYQFTVFFYGCEKAAACDSLQFSASFEGDASRGAAFANKWNATKRFSQMSVKDDGTILLRHDLSTMGGLTPVNFEDEVAWWTTMLGELGKFFDAHPVPDTPAAKATTKS